MNRANLQHYLSSFLPDCFDDNNAGLEITSVSGGSLNETHRIMGKAKDALFLKINSAKKFPQLFELEKQGLDQLSSTQTIRTPKILHMGEMGDLQLLVMEWVAEGQKTKKFWENFGARLAALHQHSDTHHGFVNDNYMGVLYQKNDRMESWIDFFTECRIKPQLALARNKGLIDQKDIDEFDSLIERLPAIFEDENPSMLHGDLWSGNFLCDEHEQPVLIDPAVYFGHRSMDLAMTKLFGGFDETFYSSYNHHFAFPKNHDEQWDVCNLYPLLIHLNLFGISYKRSIREILKKFH